LIENSLDAGATDIRIEVREGGRRLLRITDNGHGIPAAEAPLAFARHATSKLRTVDDLNHIVTFGFRGEALYSIAAVSHFTLTTRARSEDFAVTLRLEGGNLASQGRTGAPAGTVVSVENLFFNVPARQKFMRAAATEAGQINAVVQRFALAYPACRFSYLSEGRLLFQSTGSGDPFDVLVKVLGLENAKQMTPIGAPAVTPANAALLPDVSEDVAFMADVTDIDPLTRGAPTGIRVAGFISLPTLTRPNRSAIELFINRRYIDDRTLTHAVVQAYHGLLPVGRFPIAVIFVEIDPEQLDVNVHPQKTQVRFVEERRVFGAVQKAVRYAIVTETAVPDVAMDEAGRLGAPTAATDTPLGAASAPDLSGWAERRQSILSAGQHQRDLDLYIPPAGPRRDFLSPEPSAATPASATTPASAALSSSAAMSSPAPQLARRQAQLPPLRVVGQINAMYIVAEGPDGVLLIDQHAAHERILYEKFLAQRFGTVEGAVAQQHLLEPLTLHVGTRLAGEVADHLTELGHVGFAVEAFGGDTFLVRAVPAVLAGEDPQRVLEEIVDSLATRRNLVGEELEDRLVKMVCKRAAIKGGQLLSDIEMQELVRQLEECQSPRTCPHGRPTMIQLAASELEKAFGRV
jgi:DNA mismatch repair protein MutL